jgi:hypothetical protein
MADRIVFIHAETGVTAFEFEVPPHPRVRFYVVHPRNGTRRYEDQKGAVCAARGFVKRWNNERKFWEREYATS